MEGEAAEITYCAKRPPLVFTHYALGRILYYFETMPFCDIHNSVHFTGDSGIMDSDDRLRFFADRFLYLFFIDVHGIGSDIDKDETRAKEHGRVCGGRKGETWKYHFISRPDT